MAQTTHDALPEELAGLTELIGDTAIRLLQCLEAQWKLRNEKNRAWEKEAGITERKTKAARRGWRTLIAPLGRRKKPISELKEGTYKHSREKREERIALHKAFGPPRGGMSVECMAGGKESSAKNPKGCHSDGRRNNPQIHSQNNCPISKQEIKGEEIQNSSTYEGSGRKMPRHPRDRNTVRCTYGRHGSGL